MFQPLVLKGVEFKNRIFVVYALLLHEFDPSIFNHATVSHVPVQFGQRTCH